MKKLSILLIGSLIGTAGVMTSCSEDYPGPDPVDVTSNYSNKYLGNSNLALTYEGAELTGKSVDFSTVKGKTANITLYDILPGEEELKLNDIPLSGDASGYSFSGNGTGNTTNSTFNYEGRVENGKLAVNLTNVRMANSSQLSNTYGFSEIIYGRGKDMVSNDGLYQWGESDNMMIAAPLYIDMDVELSSEGSFLYAVMTGLVKGMGSYLLAQLLDNVTLEPNGYITANYTADELMLGDQKFSEIDANDETSLGNVASFIMTKIFIPYPTGGFQQQDIIDVTTGVNRNYTLSPKGLAYWYMKDDIFYLKLDLPAILTQVMKSQGKTIDQNLIATLADAILNVDPLQLKSILNTINGQLDNSILSMIVGLDDTTFRSIISWLKVGIPMHQEQIDGNTYLSITKDTLTPFINFLPSLEPLMADIPLGSMLFNSYVMPLYVGWPLITKLNIGLGLLVDNN